MNKPKHTFLMMVMCFTFGATHAQVTDKEAIEKAIINYVDAFYFADSSRALASMVRDFSKRGYYRKEGKYVESKMSLDELKHVSMTWSHGRNIDSTTLKKVTIFDILDKTASAKVEALWGVDFLHLAKIDGDWKIINVLWQSQKKN